VLLEDGVLARVTALGEKLMARVSETAKRHPAVIEQVRGQGLMLGMRLKVTPADLVAAMRAKGVLVVAAADNVVRLLPPLNIELSHVEEAVAALEEACAELAQ
jgi:acetylornithine/N-succinyldiaminopimelate aminotransferase